MKVYCISL